MARKNKNKNTMKLWFPLIIIVLVVLGITFYIINDMKKKIKNENIENVVKTNNEINTVKNEVISENITNESVENTQVENKDANQNLTNTVKNSVSNTTTNQTSNTVSNTTNNSNAGITDKKQKAVELVKKEWGEDNSVDFVFDYVNENGEYVIAVRDRANAVVKNYFRVNLDSETVELDF